MDVEKGSWKQQGNQLRSNILVAYIMDEFHLFFRKWA
jgi:hypothetical protein